MHRFCHPLLALVLGLIACDAPATDSNEAAARGEALARREQPATAPPDAENPQDSPADPAAPEQAEAPAPGPYRLLGVLDPDRGNMVAFALKVPRAWKAEQSFKRRWQGATSQNLVYLSLEAPDGQARIEYLPATTYAYIEGPNTDAMRAQAEQMGMPAQHPDNELAPMPALAYVQQVLLPKLARDGYQLRNVGNAQQTAPKPEGQAMESRASVDGTLPNGHRARVECRLSLSKMPANGDTFYGWSVVPSITQTTTDLDAAYAHTRVAQESIVRNPAWVQAEQQAQRRGSELSRQNHEATMRQIDANTQTMTAGHNQRMADIQQQGAANTARHNDRMAAMDQDKAAFDNRMASMDKQQEIRVDGIRGESKYVDPTTGQRSKVADGYHHVYQSRPDGTVYLGTNTPIEAGQVDWQELQKVSLKDY